MVSNAAGLGLAGVTIYFSPTPNASTNPAGFATTDALGRYFMPILNGTWYVCAGSSDYLTGADQMVTVNSANVSNVNFLLVTRPTVSGRVTDLQGAPLAGATVACSTTPGATLNPGWTATTDNPGNYRQIVDSGTLYVAASAGNYLPSADRVVVATGGSALSNIDFALTPPRPHNVPQTNSLLFAAFADALPSGGAISSWPLAYGDGGLLSVLGTPTATSLGGAQWVNNKGGGDGFHFANYPQGTSLPMNGGTIVVACRPVRTGVNDPYDCLVSVLLAQFEIVVRNDTGRVWVGRRAGGVDPQYDTGVNLPNGQIAILSLVVQPNGQCALWVNGTNRWSTSQTSTFTSLTAPTWWSTDINVGKGWNGDGWSSFNGGIGDVFVYQSALSNADRQQLENDLLARFNGPGPRTITASAGTGGAIVPEGMVTVLGGANQTFDIAPSAGYTLTNVIVDGVWQGPISAFTFTNVLTNHTISASFAPITHTITASAGPNGSITPAGSVTVLEGAPQTFTFTPNPGYMVDTILVDGSSVGRANSYTFTNLLTDHTISVSFTVLVSHIITATAAANGSVFPSGLVSVPEGYSQTFIIDASYGFSVSNVVVDGVSQGPLSNYAFTNITANHTISASFSRPTVWYKFDENVGTVAADASGNARNGTLINGPTWAAGKYGNAVNMNGNNQYVSCPAGLVAALNNFTVSAWVNLRANSMWSRIFDFGTGTGVYMFLAPQGGAGTLRYAITASGNGAEQQINGPSILPTGGWQHVAVTLNGTTGVLYVNGAPVATNGSMTLKPSSLGNTTQNYIGKSQWADPYLNGLVDDFRIYPRALPNLEVQALYQGGRTITATAGVGGSISPSGPVQVNYGASRGFAITPNTNYGIADLTVDGVSQGPINSYVFDNVTADHIINATFASLSPPVLTIAPNPDGGLDISWPDTYGGQLLWSPVLDHGASWNSAGTPAHIGSVYTVTVTPTNAAAYYYLSR